MDNTLHEKAEQLEAKIKSEAKLVKFICLAVIGGGTGLAVTVFYYAVLLPLF